MGRRNREKVIGLVIVLGLIGACAPGRSIVRGNWPDGRLESAVSVRALPPRAPAPAPEIDDDWVAAEPMNALSAADLNRMRVLQPIRFAFDSAAVGNAAQQTTLQMNATWLLDNPGARIIIEGHCDERGTRRYNLALGQSRAEAARDALLGLGVDSSRIEVVSYGEELPSSPEHSEAAWAENRRAEFVIVATDS